MKTTKRFVETIESDTRNFCQDMIGYFKHSLKFKCGAFESCHERNTFCFVCCRDGGVLKVITSPGSERKKFSCKVISCSFKKDKHAAAWDGSSVPKLDHLDDLAARRFSAETASDGDVEIPDVDSLVDNFLKESSEAISLQKNNVAEKEKTQAELQVQAELQTQTELQTQDDLSETSEKTLLDLIRLKNAIEKCNSIKRNKKPIKEDCKEDHKTEIELDADEYGELLTVIANKISIGVDSVDAAISSGAMELCWFEEGDDVDLSKYIQIDGPLYINLNPISLNGQRTK